MHHIVNHRDPLPAPAPAISIASRFWFGYALID
jgi:hypothetical protein